MRAAHPVLNRVQNSDGFLVRREPLLNFSTDALNRLAQGIQHTQVLGQQEAMMCGHTSF